VKDAVDADQIERALLAMLPECGHDSFKVTPFVHKYTFNIAPSGPAEAQAAMSLGVLFVQPRQEQDLAAADQEPTHVRKPTHVREPTHVSITIEPLVQVDGNTLYYTEVDAGKEWTTKYQWPLASSNFVELGSMTSWEVHETAICLENDIPTSHAMPSLEAQAQMRTILAGSGEAAASAGASEAHGGSNGREDFRTSCTTFTIDDALALDMDDALHVRPLASDEEGEGWEVGVHITDVSAHVEDGSPLDDHARLRGSTTYLPSGTVVSMFPHELATDVFSLVEGQDRPVLSILFTVGRDGTIVSARWTEGLIRTAAKLSYEAVGAALQQADEAQQLDTLVRLTDEERAACGGAHSSARADMFVGQGAVVGPAAAATVTTAGPVSSPPALKPAQGPSGPDFAAVARSLGALKQVTAAVVNAASSMVDGVHSNGLPHTPTDPTAEARALVAVWMKLANKHVAKAVQAAHPGAAVLRLWHPPSIECLHDWLCRSERSEGDGGASPTSLRPSAISLEDTTVELAVAKDKALRRELLLEGLPLQRALEIETELAVSPLANMRVQFGTYCPAALDNGRRASAATAQVLLPNPLEGLYTTFTSPIRRFADLVLHRQLKLSRRPCVEGTATDGTTSTSTSTSTSASGSDCVNPTRVALLCDQLNAQHHRSRAVDKELRDVETCHDIMEDADGSGLVVTDGRVDAIDDVHGAWFVVYVTRLGRTQKVKRPKRKRTTATAAGDDEPWLLEVDERGVPRIRVVTVLPNSRDVSDDTTPPTSAPFSAFDGAVSRCGSREEPGEPGAAPAQPLLIQKGWVVKVLLSASFGMRPLVVVDVVASAPPPTGSGTGGTESRDSAVGELVAAKRRERSNAEAEVLGLPEAVVRRQSFGSQARARSTSQPVTSPFARSMTSPFGRTPSLPLDMGFPVFADDKDVGAVNTTELDEELWSPGVLPPGTTPW
jgi:hypothetical protein